MIRSHSIRAALLAVVSCLAAGPATQPAPASIAVDGVVAHPLSWSAAELRSNLAAQVTEIHYDIHDQHHVAHAVPLLAVLQSAGVGTTLKMDPKVDPKVKNYSLRLSVVVKGTDGYTATFALAELLPEIGDRPVWIALDADGKPLADRFAPVELISPGDVKPGRWVRGIASITVVDPAAAATRPAR
jgi:hypothetical protein